MINLLPYDVKHQLKAAKVNVALLRYSLIICASIIFLSAVCFGIYILLSTTKSDAQNSVLETQVQNEGSLSSTEAQANTIRSNLTRAKTVLDRDLRYSNVLMRMAAILPSGVVLDDITLDSDSFNTPLDLELRARNNDAALDLKSRFQNSPYFSGFNLRGLSQSGTSEYPTIINITITINRSAAL